MWFLNNSWLFYFVQLLCSSTPGGDQVDGLPPDWSQTVVFSNKNCIFQYVQLLCSSTPDGNQVDGLPPDWSRAERASAGAVIPCSTPLGGNQVDGLPPDWSRRPKKVLWTKFGVNFEKHFANRVGQKFLAGFFQKGEGPGFSIKCLKIEISIFCI